MGGLPSRSGHRASKTRVNALTAAKAGAGGGSRTPMPFGRSILSRLRLPFRHTGQVFNDSVVSYSLSDRIWTSAIPGFDRSSLNHALVDRHNCGGPLCETFFGQGTSMLARTLDRARAQPATAAAIVIAVVGVLTMAGFFYFQYVLGSPPCPLC